MKRLQRLAVNHQRDGDVFGAADAVEMVLDVADAEVDLVEVGKVVDDLQLARRRRLGGCAGTDAAKAAPKAETVVRKMLRRCIGTLRRWLLTRLPRQSITCA